MRALIVLLLVLAVVVAGVVLGYTQISAQSARAQQPVQPIAFSHVIHAKTVGLDCQFCHRTAATSSFAGMPSLQQCMFCHVVVGQQLPEVQKLLAAWQNSEPVNWVRVYGVPDHVQFTHQPHIAAGVACSTCHGDVQEMPVVRQAVTLNMGFCVDCHRKKGAPTDCATCHY